MPRRSTGNPRYAFDTVAGRPVLLLFLGSAKWPSAAQALATIERHRALFDDVAANVLGVSIDPEDAAEGRIAPDLPGVRWFVDRDRAVSRLCGAVAGQDGAAGQLCLPAVLLRRGGAKVREANMAFVSQDLTGYRALA